VSRIQSIADGTFNPDKTKWTNDEVAEDRFLQLGDILLSHINSEPQLAKTALFRGCSERVIHGINLLCLRPNREIIVPDFLAYWLKQDSFIAEALTYAKRAVNQASITGTDLKGIEIPLPPISEQRRLVAELDAEAAQMEAVCGLILRFEAKIQRVLDRVWGNGSVAVE
jgi:type I restriction enzyme S subunit